MTNEVKEALANKRAADGMGYSILDAKDALRDHDTLRRHLERPRVVSTSPMGSGVAVFMSDNTVHLIQLKNGRYDERGKWLEAGIVWTQLPPIPGEGG